MEKMEKLAFGLDRPDMMLWYGLCVLVFAGVLRSYWKGTYNVFSMAGPRSRRGQRASTNRPTYDPRANKGSSCCSLIGYSSPTFGTRNSKGCVSNSNTSSSSISSSRRFTVVVKLLVGGAFCFAAGIFVASAFLESAHHPSSAEASAASLKFPFSTRGVADAASSLPASSADASSGPTPRAKSLQPSATASANTGIKATEISTGAASSSTSKLAASRGGSVLSSSVKSTPALAANVSGASSAPQAVVKPTKAASKKCKCASSSSGASSSADADRSPITTNVLIVLSAPWRYFSAAHWFHICEYYLPHHAAAAPDLVTNGTVFIQAPHDRFTPELTQITFLLLMLAFTNGSPARVEVVPPNAVKRQRSSSDSSSNIAEYATVRSTAGAFIYDGLEPNPLKRFRRSTGEPFPSKLGELASASPIGGVSWHVPSSSSSSSHDATAAPAAADLGTTAAAATTAAHNGGGQLCTCARVIGEFGAAPVERGYWFRGGPNAVQQTRERLHRLCSAVPWAPVPKSDAFVYGTNRFAPTASGNKASFRQKFSKKLGKLVAYAGLSAPQFLAPSSGSSSSGSSSSSNSGGGSSSSGGSSGSSSGGAAFKRSSDKRRRLVLYQRNRDRRLRDHESATFELGRRLGPQWAVELDMHDDRRHPCELLAKLRDADVLLTPHGFQTVLLVFMPQGSAVFEIFPYKYWKDGYRPLANEYGLFHGWSQNHRATSPPRNLLLSFISQTACMQWARCREFARRDDVNLDEATVKAIALLARHASGDLDATSAAAAAAAAAANSAVGGSIGSAAGAMPGLRGAPSSDFLERNGYHAVGLEEAQGSEPWYRLQRRLLSAVESTNYDYEAGRNQSVGLTFNG